MASLTFRSGAGRPQYPVFLFRPLRPRPLTFRTYGLALPSLHPSFPPQARIPQFVGERRDRPVRRGSRWIIFGLAQGFLTLSRFCFTLPAPLSPAPRPRDRDEGRGPGPRGRYRVSGGADRGAGLWPRGMRDRPRPYPGRGGLRPGVCQVPGGAF